MSTKVDDCMTGAPLGFWDYAVATQKGRDDDLGAFLRLIGRRVIAPPKAVGSVDELAMVLQAQRVKMSAVAIQEIWTDFQKYCDWRTKR